MFSKTITVFNRHENDIGIFWYPYVLAGVHLEDNRAVMLKKYGPECSSKAQLHVKYKKLAGNVIIKDAKGNCLKWLPTKEWQKLGADDREKAVTFDSVNGFFIEGAWEGEAPVNNALYENRRYSDFYGYLNSNMDYVYRITTVGKHDLIPHFEILGA